MRFTSDKSIDNLITIVDCCNGLFVKCSCIFGIDQFEILSKN